MMPHLQRHAWAAAMLLGVSWLAIACAPAQSPAPLLRLHPAQLAQTVSLQQQLTAFTRDRSVTLEVLLEADAQAVRWAAVSMGQTVARLRWDGTTLDEAHAPGWPATVSGQRILSDLQLMLWPADAVRAALPAGWTLYSDATTRELRENSVAVVRVRYENASETELTQLREGYRLRVQTHKLEAVP